MAEKILDGARAKTLSLGALAISAAFVLTSCAGSASGGGGGGGEAGEGFAYGASQEDVDAAVEDLDPITITFQPAAASAEAVTAASGQMFAEMVEERSNGKITVDIVYGQAVADLQEVYAALADGRVDVAWGLPPILDKQFPASNDIGIAVSKVPASPLVGELVGAAVADELGWDSDALLQSYEEAGLVPLSPALYSGQNVTDCTTSLSDLDAWAGKSIRVSSPAMFQMVTSLGGSPVSLTYLETYEALERGAVACNVGGFGGTIEGGINEIAPETGYGTDVRFPITPAAEFAGADFQTWPLAYQQIVFDSANLAGRAGGAKIVIDAAAIGVGQAKGAGGTVEEYSNDVLEAIDAENDLLIGTVTENARIGDDVAGFVTERSEYWREEFERLGYEDAGNLADFDEWYDEDTDYMPYAQFAYENSGAMDHRPE